MIELSGSGWKKWMNRSSVQITRTLRDTVFSKWILVTLPLVLIPFFIALYMVFDPPENIENWPEVFNVFSFFIYMQILFLLFSLVYGTSLMNEEIESRTITYLFMRGSKRFEVLVYKFIAMHAALTFLFSVSIVLTFFTLSLHTSTDVLVDHLLQLVALICAMFFGTFAYLALFTFIGVLFKRPLVVGLIFAFFWEVFMVNLELNVQQVTIMYYIRSIYLGTDAVREYTEIDNKAGVAGSILALIFLGGIFLLLACLTISRKDVN
jgi:ABC-type transport system involved in multi-copper enzyme maturation permease subunit